MSWRRPKRKRPLGRQAGRVSAEEIHAEIKRMVAAGILEIEGGKPVPDDPNEEMSIRIKPGIEIVFNDPRDPDKELILREPEATQ